MQIDPRTFPSISRIETAVEQVFSTHEEIRIAYIYGSYVQGNLTKFSDIDIGIVHARDFNPGALYTVSLQLELEDWFRKDTSVQFDIRTLNGANPRFLNQAVRHGKRIYSTDPTFTAEYEVYVTRAYLDIKPLLDTFDANYMKQNVGDLGE
jgi:predicted nucleotidyltransferase